MAVPLKLVFLAASSFIFLAGPILLSIGVALVLVRNDRSDKVDYYNSAVLEYDSNEIKTVVAAGTDSVQNPFMGYRETDVAIVGEASDVSAATSVSAYTLGSPMTGSFVYTIAQVGTITRAMNPSMTQPTTLYTITADFAECEQDSCTVADMNSWCQAKFGANAQATLPSGTCGRGLCYECGYPSFIKEVCVVVSKDDAGNWVEDATLKSCFYPFAASSFGYGNTQTDLSSGITFSVRTSTDPLVVMQRLTDGTMDFGPTGWSDKRAGIGLIVVGAALTVGLIFLAVFIATLVAQAAALPSPADDAEMKNKKIGVNDADVEAAAAEGETSTDAEQNNAPYDA